MTKRQGPQRWDFGDRKPGELRLGQMHKNGQARCGGCRHVYDKIHGGRERRRAQGWTYTSQHVLGWVCPSCSRWVRRRSRLDEEKADREPSPGPASPRGFGAKSVEAPERVIRKRARRSRQRARRRERRAENRRQGLPPNYVETATMSPSEYARWKKDRAARE